MIQFQGEYVAILHLSKMGEKDIIITITYVLLVKIYLISARPELVEGFERSILQQVQDER